MSRVRVHDDVLAQITRYCDLGVLSTMARACSIIAHIVHVERRRRVLTGLIPFSDGNSNTPTDILRLLDAFGAVITGSFALDVIVPGVPVGNLNIVVGKGRLDALRAQIESWHFHEDKCPERVALHAAVTEVAKKVAQIVSLVRQPDGRCIEIIESKTQYPLDAIISFPNTLMQNFVTSSSVCCLYPRFTLERRALATSPTTPIRALAGILVKYKERGFDIRSDTRFLSAPCGAHCPLLYRDLRSDTVAYIRFSDYTASETEKRLPPRTLRQCNWLIHPGRDFRVGAHCGNMFCPRWNISWDV